MLIAVLSASGSPPQNGYGFAPITVFSSADIRSDAQSFSAVQDRDGRIFFGGNTLLQFDGERWQSTAIDGAYVLRGLSIGSDDRLWVGGLGDLGWFSRPTELTWHSLSSKLAGKQMTGVWSIFPEKNGATFVSKDEVLRWDGERFHTWPMPGARRLPAMVVNGTIYVHHEPHGLYALGASEPRIFIPKETLGEAGVLWMEARTSDWLLGTSEGMQIFRNQQLVPFAADVSDILRRERLTAGARLPDGRYAFGTFKGGIVIMRPDGALDQHLVEKDGLPTRRIASLFVDRDGQLWAMSPSHISRLDLSSGTTVFDERAGLPVQAYRSITKVGEHIVVGSENGAYVLSTDHRTFQISPGLRENVHDLYPGADNLLASGLFWVKRVQDGMAETIYESPTDVFAIAQSRRNQRLLFAEASKIVAFTPGAPPQAIVHNLPDIPRSVAEDETGNLWLSTAASGVFVARPIPGEVVKAVAAGGSSGLPALKGRCLVTSADNGSILVFADNGGWLKPNGEQQFRAIRNYPQRGITAVSEFGADGTGWVVHPESSVSAACAARISITGGEARWEPHSIPGLPVIGSPRSVFVEQTSGRDINLWIGGTKSVLRHVVSEGPLAPRPRAPLLRGLAGSAEKNTAQPITGALPYSTPSIEFEFAQPEFLRRASLRLETRIDGIDREWTPAAADASRVLTAVRDGDYTFRVRAVAETGVVSEETVFRFRVLPPWWRTTPVMVGAFIALLPLGYGAYRFRVRTLRRRNAQLEAKVRQRTKELEAASAAKTQFVANMSHDIRNPLNGIVGLALALENTKLDRRQREMVATLRECSTYLSTLVDDVLDFASIEAGRIELRPGPFVPQELLRSIVNTMKADVNAHGALLLVEADPHLPPNILGDAGRIQQILVNFVSNALKYAGGQIRLSVSTRADAIGEIEFAVTDEGPGISAEDQRTLFTKFTRVKRTQGPEIAGSGLGLAACRLLADLMGASVGVDSRVGEGARFYLRLPLTIATAPVARSTANLPNTTVLVVEDTDYNAWAAEAVLGKLGLTCERARTGTEALQMFAAKRFNVVLLDRNLPDMDGTAVARQMREMETDGPQAVLLAVTAYCTAEDRALCLEAGMDAFVGKPLTPEKLRKVLLDIGRRMLTAATVHASGESSAAPPASELDLSMLKYLSDGSPESFESQVQRFIAELDQIEARLRDAQRARDCDRVGRFAHGLLGPAKLVGATALIKACQQLEAAAKSADADRCSEVLGGVGDELKAVRAAMHGHRPAARSA